jgi:hypothetical protein
MNTTVPTPPQPARRPERLRPRLLRAAVKIAAVAGPLGYLVVETAGVGHP